MNMSPDKPEAARVPLHLRVNGQLHEVSVEPRLLLVELLRETLNLTGTHVGCDTSFCGACTVLLNGAAVKSCSLFAVQAEGGEILTVEGLARGGELHPIQQAFGQCHGLQCGFCTPGLMLASLDLLQHHPEPSDLEIRKGLAGNTCRCTGYQNIFAAIRAASGPMNEAATRSSR